jgi:hypothetical protein
MKRLTQQDMTESEQRELKTQLDRARKAQGRDLTNSENNRIKDDYIDALMAEKEKVALKKGSFGCPFFLADSPPRIRSNESREYHHVRAAPPNLSPNPDRPVLPQGWRRLAHADAGICRVDSANTANRRAPAGAVHRSI